MNSTLPSFPNNEPAVFKVETHHDVNELKVTLQNALRTSDNTTRREALKKILSAMNQSLDVSSVFPEMVQASATTDLVQKRMVLQYLSANSSLNPSLSILTVNTLLKDCDAKNPHVRSMGLSSLISLNSVETLEYIEAPIKAALRDADPDVRANGVDASLKVFEFVDRETSLAYELREEIIRCLNDADTRVFLRAILSLLEIDASVVVGNQEVVYRFLNGVQSGCIDPVIIPILLHQLLLPYTIPNKEEFYDILNILDTQLDSMNLELVCSVVLVFVELVKTYVPEDVANHLPALVERVMDGLITHLSTCRAPELCARVVNVIGRLLDELGSHTRAFELMVPYLDHLLPSLDDLPYLQDAKIHLLDQLVCDQSRTLLCRKLLALIQPFISAGDKRAVSVDAAIRLLGRVYDADQSEVVAYTIQALRNAHLGSTERRAFAPFADLLRYLDSVGDLNTYLMQHPDAEYELAYAFTWIAEHSTDERHLLALIQLLQSCTLIDHMDECPYILETIVERFLTLFKSSSAAALPPSAGNSRDDILDLSRKGSGLCEDLCDDDERKEYIKNLLEQHYGGVQVAKQESSMSMDTYWKLCVPLLNTCVNVFLRRPQESSHFVSALFSKILLEEEVIPPYVLVKSILLYEMIHKSPHQLKTLMETTVNEALDFALLGVSPVDYIPPSTLSSPRARPARHRPVSVLDDPAPKLLDSSQPPLLPSSNEVVSDDHMMPSQEVLVSLTPSATPALIPADSTLPGASDLIEGNLERGDDLLPYSSRESRTEEQNNNDDGKLL